MTLPDRRPRRQALDEQRLRQQGMPDRIERDRDRRRRNPSRARHGRRPRRRAAYAIERAIAAASSPPQAVGQNPIPTSPPVAAMPAQLIVGRGCGRCRRRRGRRCATRRPAARRSTGRRRSSRDDAWARSTMMPVGLQLRDQLPAERRSGRPSRCRGPIPRPRCRRSGPGRPSGSPARRSRRGRPGRGRARGRPRSPAARPRRPGSVGPSVEERVEVRAGTDDGQRPVGADPPSPPTGPPGRARGPSRLRHVVAGQPRPTGEQRDVVGPVVVALEVQVAGRLRRGGEHLERHVALDQPRDVDVATLAARQQVAAPEQRIRVEVDDRRAGVDLARLLGGLVGRRGRDPVQAPLGPRHGGPAAGPCGDGAGDGRCRGDDRDRPRASPHDGVSARPRPARLPDRAGPRRGTPATSPPARARGG